MKRMNGHTNQEGAMLKETETETRLRRATDALATARRQEDAARRALAQAVQSTARAREKFSELLNTLGQEEVRLQMTDYRYYTK